MLSSRLALSPDRLAFAASLCTTPTDELVPASVASDRERLGTASGLNTYHRYTIFPSFPQGARFGPHLRLPKLVLELLLFVLQLLDASFQFRVRHLQLPKGFLEGMYTWLVSLCGFQASLQRNRVRRGRGAPTAQDATCSEEFSFLASFSIASR